jgi:predicted phosphodiesterase
MRLALTADVHGRWEDAASFARRHRCEAILVAGDLGEAAYSVPWPVPVYWVWGDDDSCLVWRHLTDSHLPRLLLC